MNEECSFKGELRECMYLKPLEISPVCCADLELAGKPVPERAILRMQVAVLVAAQQLVCGEVCQHAECLPARQGGGTECDGHLYQEWGGGG